MMAKVDAARRAPRRQRGEGSVSQRTSDGMWRGLIDIGIVNGKRRRKAVYASTQAECIRKLRVARKEIEAGNLETSSMRLDKWLRFWLDNIAANETKPKTLRDYRSKVEQYLIPTIGHHKIDRLTPIHVREMHAQLRDRKPPLSSTTIGHAHRVLGNALNAAMREVGLTRNVAELVDAPGNAKNNRVGLSVDDVMAVLNTATSDPLFARWLAAFVTGARQGETLGLRWDYVNLETGIIDFAWSLQAVPWRHGCVRRGEPATCGRKKGDRCPKRILAIRDDLEYEQLAGSLCLLRPKTEGSKRVIPMVPALTAALRLHRDQQTGTNPHRLVWPRADGRPQDDRIDRAAWVALLERADVHRVTLHEARHTTGTLLMDLGVPQKVIEQILGHTTPATTLGYQHADQTMTRAALNQLGEALSLDALPAGAAAD